MEEVKKEIIKMNLGEIVDDMITLKEKIKELSNPNLYQTRDEEGHLVYEKELMRYEQLKIELNKREQNYQRVEPSHIRYR